MTYPRTYAKSTPDKIAVMMSDGGSKLSYQELEHQANQTAQLFRSLGFRPGDRVAFMLENCVELFPFVWGAQRAGLLYVAVSSQLTAKEAVYILKDSGSKLLLASGYADEKILSTIAAQAPDIAYYRIDGARDHWRDWREEINALSQAAIPDEAYGADMLYSSGTTGRPKGIVPLIDHAAPVDAPYPMAAIASSLFKMDGDTIYLCPAPLYHAAPLRWALVVQRLGGTVVVMKKYDAEGALKTIDEQKITHAQFVPTHFIRMLKIEESTRMRYNFGSLKVAMHAAAPCPQPVKRAMIDWWGPVIYEYYAGSEGMGITLATTEEWLAHPGTVGRAIVGVVHICDENGDLLPADQEGVVYFESPNTFEYHNDPAKTKQAYNKHGWSTLGDVGRLDSDGFLYLTDRKSFMIVSGGVNISLEIENYIITHEKVADVAVIGAPDEDFGEKVVAVVQLENSADAGDDLAAELEAFCRNGLSGVKIPRQFDFRKELPRSDTGKLFKRILRDEYWRNERR